MSAVLTTDVDTLAFQIGDELVDLADADYESREELDEAIHDYLADDLIGFHGSNRRTLNGELFFDVVEFTLKDGSSVVIAEDDEGDIRIMTTSGSPSPYRH